MLLATLAGVMYWRSQHRAVPNPYGEHAASESAGVPWVADTVMDVHGNTAKLSYESKLFRSIMLGRAYGLSHADFSAARIPRDISYLGSQLYSAAMTALKQPNCCYPDSASNLRKLLANTREPALLSTPSDLPPMKTDDLMLIHVYAMVGAGQDELLVALLNEALASKEKFTRVFAVAALRAYGSPQAMQKLASLRQDPEVGSIANAASALDWSNFYLPRAFAGEVPYAERNRKQLLQLAQAESRQTGTILPTMLMGFLAEDAAPAQLQAEYKYLRDLNFAPNGFLMYRHGYAVSALAFRKAADFDFWQKAYLANNVQVARMPMIRAMVLLDPQRFMDFAPQLIAAEGGGWIRYEFALAYTLIARGTQPYSYYDLFFTPSNQYRLAYPFQKDAFPKVDPKPALASWAQGKWLRDKACPSCDLSWITMAVPKRHEVLLLQGFIKMPKRDLSAYWQLVATLTDPRAKPVVAYLLAQESDPEIQKNADAYLDRIGERNAQSQEKLCCEPTLACLESQVNAAADTASSTDSGKASFTAIAEVENYLRIWAEQAETASPAAQALKVQINPNDLLLGSVQNGGKNSQWRHWLGCWRKE